MTDEIVVMTPTGCIGNRGIHRETFLRALDERAPDVIAVDAGSLDPGPSYLGLGREHSPVRNIEWDLELLLTHAVPRKIPIIIGSAGGSGAREHVDATVRMIRQIGQARNLRFKLAVIYADVDPDWLERRADQGRIEPVDHDGVLLKEVIRDSSVIVAMMGPEPIIAALDAGADVVVAGRASDAAVIGAYAIRAGCDPALALHLGDIIECGESAAVELRPVLPGIEHNRIPMIGYVANDHVRIRPAHDGLACTPQSCAAHSLYERSSVQETLLPGGVLDKSQSRFEQVDAWTTRLSGTRFLTTDPYTVLLEGVRFTGYRTVLIFGVRTPRFVMNASEILAQARERELSLFADSGNIQINYHVYGRDGVLGQFEFEKKPDVFELGVVADVVAPTQQLAHDVAQDLRSRIAFWRYPGRQTTSGNIATPFSPSVIDAGAVYEMSVYHTVQLTHPTEIFAHRLEDVGLVRQDRSGSENVGASR